MGQVNEGNREARRLREGGAHKPPSGLSERASADEATVREENDDGHAPRKLLAAHVALVAARGRARSARGGRGVKPPRASSGTMRCKRV